MYEIINVHKSGQLDKCVEYIHSKWGSSENYSYFHDAIINSSPNADTIPQFYVMVYLGEIVGCYGLIINDFISRHDLYPWFSSLYIEAKHRGNRLCSKMFDHAARQAILMGYSNLYLTTDHDGLYEKFGWQRLPDSYEPSGEQTRIYSKLLPHA